MTVLVIAEHDRGEVPIATFEALTAARTLAASMDDTVEVVALGDESAQIAPDLALHGAEVVHTIMSPVLSDYGPEAYAEAVVALVNAISPSAVVASGTSRGNEVLAGVAARLDVAFAANVVAAEKSAGGFSVTRQQWGGSLLEDVDLDARVAVLSFAHHSIEPTEAPAAGTVSTFNVDLPDELARTVIKDRTVTSAGVTLATAPVVVSGGRGMGNAEAFAMLEELAELLGGRVGCSRAVTNNGWRNHSDQVGQTGTRIAPEVYLACGISGATQHWVGAMGSKNVIAINTDAEANLVTKAGHAVIADLHEIVPAIIEEVKKRQG
ncbi:MAG: electron transfer flavoprotein subunit alpha/FixB family protein [Actinomycetia bacterium]|nr:electron transfer flavoprotein subunit alpha/FixB family protein [Actinomycetes bacterium]MCP4963285.1 electron transfer flavoprotein subunit alpha/FixB family protein [Actinomycetes bacterium]